MVVKGDDLNTVNFFDYLTGLLILLIFFQNYNLFLKRIFYVPAILLGFIILLFELLKFKISKKIYLFSCFVLILAMINIIFVRNINFTFIIKFFFEYLPIAIWLLYKKYKHNKYWILVAVVIALATELSWLSSSDNYSIMNGLSRNYVSIFPLISIFIVTILCENDCIDVPIIVPILYLIMSCLAVGRMGIVSSLLYFFLYCILFFKKNKKYSKTFKIILCILLFSALVVLLLFKYETIISKIFYRFIDSTALASNNGRGRLYILYIKKMLNNVSYFLFGVRITEITSVLKFIQGNLHSSFFQVHASFGMLGLIFIFLCIINTLNCLYKQRHYYEIIFLLVFIFRISTDFALCGFITDIMLIYYMLIPVSKEKKYERA